MHQHAQTTAVWLGQTAGTLAMVLGFIPTVCTGFWGTHSPRMAALCSLDIVGKDLDLPQSNVSSPLCGVSGEWERVGGGNGNWN